MITNLHVHTPFSLSAFRSIEELVDTAAKEGVTVLGINDLNTTDGFRSFAESCKKRDIFPVFNIEFTVEHDIAAPGDSTIRNNAHLFTDTLSGKAIPYPTPFPHDIHNRIASIWKGSQDRIWKMIDLLNVMLEKRNIPVKLDYSEIRSAFANTSVYEQHIAATMYECIYAACRSEDAAAAMFRALLYDHDCMVDTTERDGIEQAIVEHLLSPGADAYVPSAPDDTLTIAQARRLILQTGGIPCYQCCPGIDAKKGLNNNTPQSLAKKLVQRGIYAIEFTPHWSTSTELRAYMTYFHEEQFAVSIGTGHCSSFVKSMLPLTKNGRLLDDDLLDIGYKGACIFAAHRSHRIRKQPGFIDECGKRLLSPQTFTQFISEGHEVIGKQLHREQVTV